MIVVVLFGVMLPLTTHASPDAVAVTITSPANGSIQTTDTVTLEGTSTAGSTVSLMLDGGGVIPLTPAADGSWIYTATGIPDGAHTATATAQRPLTPLLWMTVIQPSAVRDQAIVADPTTGTVLARINLSGDDVEGIAISPDQRVAYVCQDAGVDVINTTTYAITATVPMPSKSELCALNPTGTELWVTLPDDSALAVIDTATLTVQTITLPNGAAPREVVFSADGAYAYTANVETINDPATVTKLDAVAKTVLQQVPGGRANRRLVLNADGTKLFVTAKNSGQVLVFNPVTMARIATIPIGTTTDTEDIELRGNRAYITHQATSDVTVMDATTHGVLPTESFSSGQLTPIINAVTIHPAFPNRLFVGNRDDVDVFDTTTKAPVTAMHMQHTPSGTGSRTYDFTWQERFESATASVTFTVDTTSDLQVVKTVQEPLTAGQRADYTLAVRNLGPADARGPITVTDTLPAALQYVSATGDGWSCTVSRQTITCTHAAMLPAGVASAPIALQTRVDAAATGRIENTATVRYPDDPDPNPSNNTSAVTTDIQVPPTATPVATATPAPNATSIPVTAAPPTAVPPTSGPAPSGTPSAATATPTPPLSPTSEPAPTTAPPSTNGPVPTATPAPVQPQSFTRLFVLDGAVCTVSLIAMQTHYNRLARPVIRSTL